MPNWVAWSGVALTLVFGVVSVLQLFQYLVDRKARDANKKHTQAIKFSLQSLRQMCAETIEIQEVIKSEATRQWVRQMSYNLLGIEHHIDALLETQGPLPEYEKLQKLQKRDEIGTLMDEGTEVLKECVTDSPGVSRSPSEAPVPRPEDVQRVDEWINKGKDFVSKKYPWFLAQFLSDTNLLTAGSIGRHYEFEKLRDRVEFRISRLAELQKQIGSAE